MAHSDEFGGVERSYLYSCSRSVKELPNGFLNPQVGIGRGDLVIHSGSAGGQIRPLQGTVGRQRETVSSSQSGGRGIFRVTFSAGKRILNRAKERSKLEHVLCRPRGPRHPICFRISSSWTVHSPSQRLRHHSLRFAGPCGATDMPICVQDSCPDAASQRRRRSSQLRVSVDSQTGDEP